jgi:hypothetical protein
MKIITILTTLGRKLQPQSRRQQVFSSKFYTNSTTLVPYVLEPRTPSALAPPPRKTYKVAPKSGVTFAYGFSRMTASFTLLKHRKLDS